MFNLEFKVNGRRVQPNQFGNELERAVLANIEQQLKSKLISIRCPEHGQYSKITAEGRNLDNLQLNVSGCCDKLIDAVKEKT